MLKPIIYFVDDEPNILQTLKRLFHGKPLTMKIFETPEAALAALAESKPDVIVSDYRMPGTNGVTLLEAFRDRSPETVRILLTGFIDMEAAVDAINRGSVYRFFRKPWDDEELVKGIQEAAAMAIIARATRGLPSYLSDLLRANSPEDAQRTATAFLASPEFLGLETSPGLNAESTAAPPPPEDLILGSAHLAVFDGPKERALLDSLIKSVLESCRIAVESAKARSELVILSERDPLSGLYNRRAIEKAMVTEWLRAKRYGKVFSVMLIDIDSFKTINDTQGHETGDKVISAMGEALVESCRAIDTPGRYGGDEFLVVLPETSQVDAVVVAERVREKARAAGERLSLPQGLTLSIGIADTSMDPLDTTRLIAMADDAMYRIKKGGKDGIATQA